jgi:hypothetical protein
MKLPYKLTLLLRKLHEANCGPIHKAGREFRCRCPAHDDGSPSLYIGASESAILLNCKAECTAEAICDRLDHDQADLFFAADEPLVETDNECTIISEQPNPETPTANAGAADPAPQRHEVYQQLLDHLELSSAHFDDLRRRGLSGEAIARHGYRTADRALLGKAIDALLTQHGSDRLLTIPGFRDASGRVVFSASSGLLIPVRQVGGTVVAIKVRHDAGHNGAKYTWASSAAASCGNVVHVSLSVTTPASLVRLTEGELKADVATVLSGIWTLSAPGVGNWRLAVPILKELGAKTVHLAFDQDGKPATLAAMEAALLDLTREGFDVKLEWWDGQANKGIDDALASGTPVETITGLAAAVRVRDAQAPPQPGQTLNAEPEPEPFPTNVFPPGLAAFCRQAAAATSTPPDFAGLVMIATAGAAIGNSRALCLKNNVWYESPRFYGANVGDPASGKTPAMDAVVKPYQAIQLRLLKQYRQQKDEYDDARDNYEKTLKENRVLPADERPPLPPVPEEPKLAERFVIMDATVESLAPILEDNPRGLLMPQDEGVGWVRGMGQYKGGRGNDRQFWLSNWSGKAHMVDRKSQGGVPISIPRPFVNVVFGLPPDMLNELADFQGRNDGFLHRILFVFPHASSGTDWTEETVTDEANLAWQTTLLRLRGLGMKELDDGVLGYEVVRFTEAAKERWIQWWDSHAAEIRGPELPIALIGPWGKLKAYCARLALVLHFFWLGPADDRGVALDMASVERAIRLIDYFKSHLRIVYSRLRQTPEDNHLMDVLDWIRKHGGQCSPRDLANAKKVTPTAQAKKVLKELEERGYGRIDLREANNNKRVQCFILDPA